MFINRLIHFPIGIFAFLYFASYIPYSLMIKALSKGYAPLASQPINGASLLPLVVATSIVFMFSFLVWSGALSFVPKKKIGFLHIPIPRSFTFVSGLCTAVIILTTTLAYSLEGISIVFAMLLMRGGVLVCAPIIDKITSRKVRWYSWIGLFFSLLALLVAFWEKGGLHISWLAGIDISLYLLAYFVRLQIMTKYAKNDQTENQIRYFAEEQMVASPLSFLALLFIAFFFKGDFATALSAGFAWSTIQGSWMWIVLVGIFSQGTGIAGGLILMSKQENSYCVPINRSSSILAGLFANVGLMILFGNKGPSFYEVIGACLVLVAILFLSLPPFLQKRNLATQKEKTTTN